MKKILILSLLAVIGCITIFSCVKSTDHTVKAYTCYCNYIYKRGNVTTDTIPYTFTVTSTYVAAQNACNQEANNTNPDPGHTLYQSVYCRFE
ncbi:MAG: hypothetical protein BGO69_07575 [Bacteroidetes bacterium 46-16]|nr:MAG: hypothetical protein BGO69_07575 [Bacteroidetes bacterium 46-16]